MARVLGAIVVVLLILGGLLWLGRSGPPRTEDLEATPIGLGGLTLEGARLAGPGLDKASDFGLRVLPLYDMDLDDNRPETLGDVSLRSMPGWAVQAKVLQMPTLIVLPKWRGAVIDKGLAAPETAVPLSFFPGLLAGLDLGAARLVRGGPVFQSDGGRVLFMAQLFDAAHLPDRCQLQEGFAGQALVLRCEIWDQPVWILSDPDMLDNHGRTLGKNADLAWLHRLAGGGRIYLDPFPEDQLAPETPLVDPDRGDALWRFFQPPLGEIWDMLAILLALFLWRGGRRFGPVQEPDERMERSRRAAIATRARLIRLTGQDAAMVADYVRTDLARMAEAALGPGRGEVARLFPVLVRRDAARAGEFQRLAQDLMRADPAPPAALRRQLETYHLLQRTLTHGHDA